MMDTCHFSNSGPNRWRAGQHLLILGERMDGTIQAHLHAKHAVLAVILEGGDTCMRWGCGVVQR